MFSLKNWNDKSTWLNWSENEKVVPNSYELPSSIEEVQTIVKRANTFNQTIRVTGAAHSFSPVAKPECIALSLHNLRGLICVDEQNHEATFYAGTYLYEIGPILEAYGFALSNMGDIQEQTLAGVISTGTHGTGLQLGSFSSMVTKWGFVAGNGDYIEHKRSSDDLSNALHVAVGLLGIIVTVTIKVLPIYNLHYTSKKENLFEAIQQFPLEVKENRHLEWFYFPGSETLQVKRMNKEPYKPADEKLRKIEQLKASTLENGLFYLMSEACKLKPTLANKVSKISSLGVSNVNRNDVSYKIFPSPRAVKFIETEHAIPIERFCEAIEEVHWTFKRYSMNVHFPIECRTTKGESGFLSPTLGRDSAFIAFHMYKGMNEHFYFNWVKELVEKYDGRAHWGKVNWYASSSSNIYELFPNAKKFNDIRMELDPNNIFMTEYFKLVFK